MELHEAPTAYEKIILYDDVKEIQVRLTVSSFRGVEYLGLRKYYLDFEEEWKPSKEGVTFPIDFANSRELLTGMLEILSDAEAEDLIKENFLEILNEKISSPSE